MKTLVAIFIVFCIAVFLILPAISQTTKKKMEVTTPADQPGTLATNHQAVLTWINPTTCTDGSPCTPVSTNVYRIVGTCSAPTSQFTKIASVGATVRTYTDPNLAAATTYCYYVTSVLAQPAAWVSTTTYTGGQIVSYNGAVYVALNNASPNLNQPPNTATTFWQLSSVESAESNTVGGSTGTTGPPQPPSSLTITVQ
jgi:hypothetical protein